MLRDSIELGARVIRAGSLVAFPTETVYGLGADVFNEKAVTRIFAVKNRPRFDPLIVHIGSMDQLHLVTESLPGMAQQLIDAFWPGPLTVIVKKHPRIPDLVTAGLPGVGVRMPSGQIARDLIAAANTPIAAPSANSFGSISPTRAEHVHMDLGDLVDLVIDGGPCVVGIESTIISCMDDVPVLLRPGGVPLEDVERVVGEVIVPGKDDCAHASPGRFQKHYAPTTPVVLDDPEKYVLSGKRLGVLAFQSTESDIPFHRVEILSPSGDLSEAAGNLFAALKRLDSSGVDVIIARTFPEEGLGRAINDRLMRAAQKTDVALDTQNQNVKEDEYE